MGRLTCLAALLCGWLKVASAAGLPEHSYAPIVESVMGGTKGARHPGSLRIVEGITTAAVGGSEKVYVASAFEWGISIFTLNGALVANWGLPANDGTGTNINIADLAVAPDGTIYASDYRGHRILVFAQDGTLVRTFGHAGSKPGEFRNPLGLKLVSGKLMLVDHGNDRVQILRPNGSVISVFGGHGAAAGQFDGAYDVAADSHGYLYVTDRENRRVQKFTPDGRFVLQWGGGGVTVDERSAPFKWPHEIAIDAKDRVYVTDLKSDAIRIFTTDGVYLDTIWMHSPKGIAIASDQSIFVGTWDGHRVFKLRPLDQHIENPPVCVTAGCP